MSFTLLFSGCAVYRGNTPDRPTVSIPDSFSPASTAGAPIDEWWTVFDEPGLSLVLQRTIMENLTLQQAWARLQQADAVARIQGAARYPQIDASAGANRTRVAFNSPSPANPVPSGTFDQYIVGAGLSYEVDLWRRVASQRKAALFARDASREDVEAAALSLAGQAGNLWFSLQEQLALRRVLREQIETSRTFLELIELRFKVGQSSALDVYQQRQQLASAEAQVPLVEFALRVVWHQLLVLQGVAPVGEPGEELFSPPEGLPDLPALDTPGALLTHRPDLRASLLRLEASDYDVAAAVADRYPRLGLSLSYQFSASDVADLLDNETGSIAGNLLAPLLDGGRRRAEVDRRKAVVTERLAAFNQGFLLAVEEVEDALARERFQKERLVKLIEQRDAAQNNLREARSRYTNGLIDYLPVITALQTLQRVERDVVSSRADLFRNRVDLYTALGGAWSGGLEQPDAANEAKRTENTGS